MQERKNYNKFYKIEKSNKMHRGWKGERQFTIRGLPVEILSQTNKNSLCKFTTNNCWNK